MTYEKILKDVCLKEDINRCNDIIIKGIPIYNFIRRDVRVGYLRDYGIDNPDQLKVGSLANRILSVIISFFHIFQLPFVNCQVLFHTFRIECINGLWMDRFFDPIIELCGFENNYIIVETNNGRKCPSRAHKKHIIYDDFIVLLSRLKSIMLKNYYIKHKYKSEFITLDSSIYSIRPSINYKEIEIYHNVILSGLMRVGFYRWMLKKIHIKSVVSASRSSFLCLLCAAKMNGVRVFELQHGITIGETETYSGFRDPLFTPDLFLSFGEIEPKNVYGIDESKIVSIGWALNNYLNNVECQGDVTENDILVLSDPFYTEYILDSIFRLAESFPEIRFYLRNHPLEILNEQQLNRITKLPNIFIQDLTCTFLIALKPFKNVLGVQSTTLYEALSYEKKVGILAMDNHLPEFLKEGDSDCFWLIKDSRSFYEFLSADVSMKKSYSIYSSFNIELFNKLISN